MGQKGYIRLKYSTDLLFLTEHENEILKAINFVEFKGAAKTGKYQITPVAITRIKRE
jgi:hypothetical protein